MKFSLKVGKRAIPLWYKIFEYNEKGNKSFKHIKQGVKKFNGFHMGGTWTGDIVYFENLYLCLCVAYTWMIILGANCSKNKKSKIIGATKKLKNKMVRIYSLFSCGIKWFNRCYDSDIKKYKLKFDLVLYDI